MKPYAIVENGEIVDFADRSPRVGAGTVVGWPPERKIVPIQVPERPTPGPLERLEFDYVLDGGDVRVAWRLVARPIAAQVETINGRAGGLIESVLPAWKQRNMIAAALDAVSSGVEPPADCAPAWAWVTSVRQHSDAMIAAVESGDTVDVVSGAINGAGEWPPPPAGGG